MYVYIDEYGNLAPPSVSTLHDRPFVLGALIVRTNRSRRRVAVAATRALRAQLSSPQHKDCRLCGRELKGDHILASVRRQLFKRLARLPDLNFYCVVVDKARLMQPLPKLYSRRYNNLMLNLIARIPLPRQLDRAYIAVDQGGAGKPKQQWQSLTAMVRNVVRKHATDVKIRVRESHRDRCLQVADVLTNFASQEMRLRLAINEAYATLATSPSDSARYEKRIAIAARHLKGWRFSSKLLGNRVKMWVIPPNKLYNQRLRNFMRARIAFARYKKGNRANRRG